jgi:hypothetical protein
MTVRGSVQPTGSDEPGRRAGVPTAGPRCPFSDPRALFAETVARGGL